MAAKVLHLNGDSIIETVYIGHDNSFSVILTNDDGAVATTSYTKMTLVVGSALIESTNVTGSAITWGKTGYAVGEVVFKLGGEALTADRYPRCYLTIYDVNSTEGIVWAALNLLVLDDVEVTT